MAVGDNYHGFRIVGTTLELFDKTEYAPGKKFELQPGGGWFDPARRDAVVWIFCRAQNEFESRRHLSPVSWFDLQ